MRWRVIVAAALGLVVTGVAAQQIQQGQANGIESRPRFQGSARLGLPGSGTSLRIEVRLWSIGGGQKNTRLEQPFDGDVVAELRGGRLTTVIAGQRTERREGDIWLVPAGTAMGVETGSDMATLQTWLVAQP